MIQAVQSAFRPPPVAVGLALRGVTGLGLGLAAALQVGATLPAASSLLLAYVFADALATFFLAYSLKSRALMVAGAADGVLGIVLLLFDGASAYGLTALVGFWAMSTGLLGLIGTGALARAAAARYGLGASATAGIVLGTCLGVLPHTPLADLLKELSAFGFATGCLLLWAAFSRKIDAITSWPAEPSTVNSHSAKWKARNGTAAGGPKENP